MAISNNLDDREKAAFEEDSNDQGTNKRVSVKNSAINPVIVNDSTQFAGLDTTLTIGAGLTVELKVGSSPKLNRKYILIQAKGNGVKFGFNDPAIFDAFNNQILMMPFGTNTSVYLTNTSGSSRTVLIGEA